MRAPCITTVPEPFEEYIEIIADGWTAVAYTNGYLFAIIFYSTSVIILAVSIH